MLNIDNTENEEARHESFTSSEIGNATAAPRRIK